MDSTLVWDGQTTEKDGDAFFHLSYEWTGEHWKGLISHQPDSNISEIKRFSGEFLIEGDFFHWYHPISVPKRKPVVPVPVKKSPCINWQCNKQCTMCLSPLKRCIKEFRQNVSFCSHFNFHFLMCLVSAMWSSHRWNTVNQNGSIVFLRLWLLQTFVCVSC